MKNTLFESLKEAGIETSNHESDLYFPVTEESRKILAAFPQESGIATRFINQREPNRGQPWFDVPFAFLPWWEKRQNKVVTGSRAAVGYQPKTGESCHCKPGTGRDNCPDCEGTGMRINFAAIRARRAE